MPSKLIVLWSVAGKSGIAKDTFENVLHFENSTSSAVLLDDAHAAAMQVADFYCSADATLLQSIAGNYSAALMPNGTIKVYDFAAAKPRPVLYTVDVPLLNAAGNNAMPEQIALCLSYFSARNIPRSRGRIYFGPIKSSAIDVVTAGGVRPSTNLKGVLLAGGERLIAAAPASVAAGKSLTSVAWSGSPTPLTWALYSPHDNAFKAITNIWVDDEWDGQSRRRVLPTTRISFP